MFYSTYAAGVSRVYGEEYAHRWMLPVKSLLDAGAKVSYGADTHTDPERQPMFNLEVLVTRRVKDGRVFGPREIIDRRNALLMLTRWGADYVLRNEELGSLEPGKLADLVVLDKNPLDRNVADEDLSEIKIMATVIGGEVVYGALTADNLDGKGDSLFCSEVFAFIRPFLYLDTYSVHSSSDRVTISRAHERTSPDDA